MHIKMSTPQAKWVHVKNAIVVSVKFKKNAEQGELTQLLLLQTVQLCNSFGFGLIECLKKRILKRFKFVNVASGHITPAPASIKDLLRSQKNLKTLALWFGCEEESGEYLSILDETLPFQLTSLSLKFHSQWMRPRLSFTDYQNVTKFIETQSQTIKSL